MKIIENNIYNIVKKIVKLEILLRYCIVNNLVSYCENLPNPSLHRKKIQKLDRG